jgi:hypothetical protein
MRLCWFGVNLTARVEHQIVRFNGLGAHARC